MVGSKRMTYGEAVRLTERLLTDPSSHIAASVQGWEHAWSREWKALVDLFDLQHASKSTKGRPTPYPRPWASRQLADIEAAKARIAETRARLEAHRAQQ